MILWLTPSLKIDTDLPARDYLTAEQAISHIEATSGTDHAVVRDEATARQVLQHFGLTEDEIADRFSFARTGRLVHGR
jgi:hypothetical protein